MRISPLGFLLCIAFALTGCLGSGGGGGQKGARDSTADGNRSPTIAGSPPRSALVNEPYDFVPTAADPDGDVLVFQIVGKPRWANFDPASGRLWGVPGTGDAGNFANIRVSVADGHATVALTTFSIAVTQGASGSVTLSWEPPTLNADGSTLNNLAGYRIYYGRSPDDLDQSVVLRNPGLTRYVIENLSPAHWHFAMTSINSSGYEGKRSTVVGKQVA